MKMQKHNLSIVKNMSNQHAANQKPEQNISGGLTA